MKLFNCKIILPLVFLLITGCSQSTDVDLPITSSSEAAKELYKKAWYYWDQGEGLKG